MCNEKKRGNHDALHMHTYMRVRIDTQSWEPACDTEPLGAAQALGAWTADVYMKSEQQRYVKHLLYHIFHFITFYFYST